MTYYFKAKGLVGHLLSRHVGLVLLQRLPDVGRHEVVLQQDVVGHELLHRLAEAGHQQLSLEIKQLRLLVGDVDGADFDVGLEWIHKHVAKDLGSNPAEGNI